MRLMACLFANGYTSQTDRLPALLPRLWPYFRHTLSTVRLTAVQCLSSLLALAEGPVLWMTPSVFASILQLAFQNFLLEADSEIVRVSQVHTHSPFPVFLLTGNVNPTSRDASVRVYAGCLA